MKSLSRPRLLATPRTAAYQAPPSMGFSRQEYWSGVPLPSLRRDARWQIQVFQSLEKDDADYVSKLSSGLYLSPI